MKRAYEIEFQSFQGNWNNIVFKSGFSASQELLLPNEIPWMSKDSTEG